ncbi:MAG: hypothetical protein U0169_21825 [Polyangiaceae bacterium]
MNDGTDAAPAARGVQLHIGMRVPRSLPLVAFVLMSCASTPDSGSEDGASDIPSRTTRTERASEPRVRTTTGAWALGGIARELARHDCAIEEVGFDVRGTIMIAVGRDRDGTTWSTFVDPVSRKTSRVAGAVQGRLDPVGTEDFEGEGEVPYRFVPTSDASGTKMLVRRGDGGVIVDSVSLEESPSFVPGSWDSVRVLDGGRLVTWAVDETSTILDVATGWRTSGEGIFEALSSAEGRRSVVLWTADAMTVTRVGATTASWTRATADQAGSVFASEDGTRVVVASRAPEATGTSEPSEKTRFTFVDAATGRELSRFDGSLSCGIDVERPFAFAGDVLRVHAECNPGCASIPWQDDLRTYDVRTGKLVGRTSGVELPSMYDGLEERRTALDEARRKLGLEKRVLVAVRTTGTAHDDVRTGFADHGGGRVTIVDLARQRESASLFDATQGDATLADVRVSASDFVATRRASESRVMRLDGATPSDWATVTSCGDVRWPDFASPR